jgi:hypothetical protein
MFAALASPGTGASRVSDQLFQDFDKADLAQVPQILSDHPDNPHRVDALKRHFRQNPAVFGKFSPDQKGAKPIAVPKDATEQFLR